MRALTPLLLLLLSALPGAALAAGDPVLKAMNAELSRSMAGLKMESLQRPYFLSYTVLDSSETSVSASFGALTGDLSYFTREASVELRVGSAAFDSSGFVGKDYGGYAPARGGLAAEPGPDALRFSLWSLTDDAYKRALEKYSQKLAYSKKKNIAEFYGDLSPAAPARSLQDEPPSQAFDRQAWKALVRDLSAVFRKYPAVHSSSAEFTRALRATRFAASDGGEYRYFWEKADLSVRAMVQEKGGLYISDELRLSWPSLAAAPGREALLKEVHAFASALSGLAAPATAEVYLGPVLFEGQAAAEFLGQLFVDNLSYGRLPWAENDDWTRYYILSGGLTKKLGMRVLPAFMSAYDDPSAPGPSGERLLGSYPVDAEGVKPGRLELAKNGRLAGFYAGRTPVKEYRSSNGHARGFINEYPTPRPGSVFFSADAAKRLPPAELKSRLLAAAAESGLDYAVLVRRLDPPAQNEPGQLLSAPVQAYRVSVKDGAETPLAACEWTGVTFRALRDILLVSDSDQVYNYYQPGPFLANRGFVPASLVSPGALLVQEMELKPAEAKPDRKPYLPHPYFAAAD